MKTFLKTAWRSRKDHIRFFIFISIICSKRLAPSAKPTLEEPTCEQIKLLNSDIEINSA
jgi:hypothetical protein